MISINKKFSVAILSMVILLGTISSANAQGWRRWNRDNGTSKKEKAVWIGGGAAAGAVVGGLLNGKTGAIVGGLLGAGAGTATAIIKDRNDDDRYERYGNRRYYSNRNNSYNSYNSYNDGYRVNRFNDSNRYGNGRYVTSAFPNNTLSRFHYSYLFGWLGTRSWTRTLFLTRRGN